MKKTFALLLACLMLVAMLPGTAMAYDKATLTTTSFPHTLKLTEANLHKLPEDVVIAYKYSVGAAQSMVIKNGSYTYSEAKGVTGIPTITGNNGAGSVKFDANSVFSDGVSTVNMSVDWTPVSITEPGIYLWEVTKAIDEELTEGTNGNHSDYDTKFYLFVIALNNDTSTGLNVKAFGISMEDTLADKSGSVDDTYPVQKVNLQIKKQVTGNMASANQYFPFTVNLETLPGTYTVKVPIENVPATNYNDAQVNNASVTVQANGEGEITIWLKHNDTATIEGLPFGTGYVITETVTDDFAVSATISGDKDAVNAADKDKTVSDTSMMLTTTVTYTNEKNATVPTGISLHTAAPVMGILLAMSLLAILFVGKRKEYVA